MKTLMRWLGWVPLKDLAEVQSEMADHVFSMRRWADKHEERSEHEFRKLAEQLADPARPCTTESSFTIYSG